MEEGVPTNEIRLLLERQAARCLDLLQGGQVGEAQHEKRYTGESFHSGRMRA